MTPTRHKAHREFFRIATDPAAALLPDAENGWQPAPGYEGWIDEIILADSFDTTARTGSRTRLARWRPGTLMPAPVIHEFHEEVFLVRGDLIVGCDAQGRGGRRFDAHTFACRPPGVLHGPFTSIGGCLMLEFMYFD